MDHGVSCKALLIHQILIRKEKVSSYGSFVPGSLFTRLKMVDRYFIIENPAVSKIWFTKCFQRLLMKHAVTYGTLGMCAFGMRNPYGFYYKPKSLLHNFPDGFLFPILKRCSNKSKKYPIHFHQQLEGSAPGLGSRTKLAQVYPYRFCSTLIRCILPLGNPRALYPSSLAVDLLEDLDCQSVIKDLSSSLMP